MPMTPDPGAGARQPARQAPSVVLLSSSLLTDRMLLYSEALPTLGAYADTTVWATSVTAPAGRLAWSAAPTDVRPFPAIRAFKEFPHNYLRRLNEFVWDYRLRPPSRLSAMRHVRDKYQAAHLRALKLPARGLAVLGVEHQLEDWLERVLLAYPRSLAATERFRASRPNVVVTTGPYRFDEPAVAAAAKAEGIPVLALITSWDNLSTKSRMVLKYDGYLVWSEQMRRELHHFCPASRGRPVFVIGAPQFDVFFQPRFRQSRAAFCAAHGLDPARPIILYGLGSPNFLHEHHGAVQLAERLVAGELGDVQMLVRPHPLFDTGEDTAELRRFGPRVVIQRTGAAGVPLTARSQSEAQIVEWVSTYAHAAVVVNLSSTVTVDAAILDRPVVNLDYDPEPGQPNQALVKDVNHLWTHFRPIAESGGVWLTNDLAETVRAVQTYLRAPELHCEKRRWIAQYVCGELDGHAGRRLAEAVLDFLGIARAGIAHAAPARARVPVGG